MAENFVGRSQIPSLTTNETEPGDIEQQIFKPDNSIIVDCVCRNDRPSQSLFSSSPSSIKRSGLIRSQLPAKEDRDWYGELAYSVGPPGSACHHVWPALQR